ncbi:MAG: hypothetical protein NC225_12185 [Clostridium sp.]|nr:hypothetical protein [Clostridium sp.]MCM1400227.1 hypothetical protein [Clostridium sp.]MCM1460320.1 hypothetical protein [Bacteroides sp.]
MSKGNTIILLVLLAVVMVGGVYLYVYKPNMEEVDTLQAEVDTLQARYDELYAKSQDKQRYIDETKEFREAFQTQLTVFPATLDQEISVMFVKGINKDEGDRQFDVASVGLGRPEQFYSLGTVASAEETEGTEDVASAAAYTAYKAAFPITYTGSYEGIKEYVDYVMNYKYRMNIDSLNITYDAEADVYNGSVSMNAYCVTGGDRKADTISVDVKNGVANIFLGGEGAASPTTYAYDEDNGASLASNNDIKIVLNNANNDNTDGIIVSSGGSDTYVTSAENSVETLTITIAEEDGKNFVTYAIGDKSYKKEITSTDLKIYVESSARVDSSDTNGVKVTVDNKTSVPVFFKVSGDDSTSPRFSVGSKSGTVKVY